MRVRVRKSTLLQELDKVLETMLSTPIIVEAMTTQHVVATWDDGGIILMLSVTTEDSEVVKNDS